MKLTVAILSALLMMVFILACPFTGRCNPPEKEYYEIRVYQLSGKDQEAKLDDYLKNAFVPALHRMGITKVGVFKPRDNDTTAKSRWFVFIPYKSLRQFESIQNKLETDRIYNSAADEYMTAYDNPPYQRMEKILARAFPKMPVSAIPNLTAPRSDRVYELRSYESATEKLHRNKVKMFNAGNEVSIFKRLGFNAVFYSQVIVGRSMPNLMYMTTFDNMQSHDEHWKNFGSDEEWKKLVKLPEYQHNVSHQDIYLLYPAEYSDI